ncbi:MAG TPA: hypothetical protein VNF47_13260 [Streptosporangiaceae bacterium]|nr:hypothetical protein [Streptosporangiaceae bacterium]
MTQPTLLDLALQRAAAVSSLIQGEVLGAADACVVIADAAAPLSPEAVELITAEGIASGLITVPHAVDEVVLLTQTCDLQFTTPNEHRCLVAPVIRVTEKAAYEALRGRRPGLAGLPWVAPTTVADLSRITTVERSVLVGVVSRGRPRTPSERFHFAETISRYLTRPALPNPINAVLSPFVNRIAEKHDKQSAEGRCAHKVSELRLEATPDIDHEEPALNVLMILEELELPKLPRGALVDDARVDQLITAGRGSAADAVHRATDPVSKREAWIALAECWIKPSVDLAPTVDGVGSVEISVLNGEELSYARSLNAPILDLRYLSTRAA